MSKITRKDLEARVKSGEDVSNLDLTGANLSEADLRRVNLRRVNLRDANLRGADLRGADLYGANLRGADLLDANLSGVRLCRADLTGAHLTGANLTEADLTGVRLCRADLTGANLTGTTVCYNSHRLLSEILVRAATTRTQGEFAAYVRVRTDLCWETTTDDKPGWLELYADDERLEWALREVAKWHKKGDNAPECVLKYVEAVSEEETE